MNQPPDTSVPSGMPDFVAPESGGWAGFDMSATNAPASAATPDVASEVPGQSPFAAQSTPFGAQPQVALPLTPSGPAEIPGYPPPSTGAPSAQPAPPFPQPPAAMSDFYPPPSVPPQHSFPPPVGQSPQFPGGWASPHPPSASTDNTERVGLGLLAVVGLLVVALGLCWFFAWPAWITIFSFMLAMIVGIRAYRAINKGILTRGKIPLACIYIGAVFVFSIAHVAHMWWAFSSALPLGDRVNFTMEMLFSETSLTRMVVILIGLGLVCALNLRWVFSPTKNGTTPFGR